MDTNTPTLINQFMVSIDVNDLDAATYSGKIAGHILKNELSLLNFIRHLGDYLTRDDDLLRPKAINCLSSTLQQISNKDANKLSKQDIIVLVDFYISKFDDKFCILESLKGLNALIQMKKFTAVNIRKMLDALSEKYDPTKNMAKIRYLSFQIVDSLLGKYQIFISSNLNDIFVKTFIHIASGEKDPRNLMLSFQINTKINKEMQTDGFVDDLFDISFCYFPISFTPPKDDPYKITSEELKQSLRNTISSNSQFAKESFPSLIEKLTSTNPKVKNDVLLTIKSCVESYSVETIEEFWLTLWNALKFEILHSDLSTFSSINTSNVPNFNKSDEADGDIFTLLLVLQIFQAISIKLSSNDLYLNGFLAAMKAEFLPNVSNPESKSFKQSCIILAFISETTASAFDYIVKNLVGTIFEYIYTNESSITIPKQRILIENLGFFLNSFYKLSDDLDLTASIDFLEANSLLAMKDSLLMFLGKSLMTSSKMEITLRTATISQLIKLINLKSFLTSDEVNSIFQYFNELLITDDNEIVMDKILDGLSEIIRNGDNMKINSMIGSIYPHLLSFLPDETNLSTKETKVLNMIVKISNNKQILEYLSIRILNKLLTISDSKTISTSYVNLLITTLFKMIQDTERESSFLMNSWYKNFVPKFLEVFFKIHNKIDDDLFVENAGNLLYLIILNIEKKLHEAILNDILNTFIFGKESNLSSTKGIDLLNHPTKVINIFLKLIASIDKNATLNFDSGELIVKLLKVAYHSSDNYTSLGYLQSVAVMANKFISPEDLKKACADYIISRPDTYFDASSIRRIETLTWLCKGLIIKDDVTGNEIFDMLLLLLKDKETSPYASKALEIIFVDIPIFSKNSKSISGVINLNIRLLYKQKNFQKLIEALINNFNDSVKIEKALRKRNEQLQENYLITLSLILKNVSSAIILQHIDRILPLILESLNISNSTVTSASLQTLFITIENETSFKLIENHLQTIIPKLIELSKPEKTTENIRFNALNILRILPSRIELQKLVPYQKDILKNLIIPLDDKKRSIRKIACDCRQEYYELGRDKKV